MVKFGKYLLMVLLVASSNLFAVSMRESLSSRFSQFSSLRPSAVQVKKLPSLLKAKAKTYKKTTALLMTPVIFYLFKKAVEQDPKFQEAKRQVIMNVFFNKFVERESLQDKPSQQDKPSHFAFLWRNILFRPIGANNPPEWQYKSVNELLKPNGNGKWLIINLDNVVVVSCPAGSEERNIFPDSLHPCNLDAEFIQKHDIFLPSVQKKDELNPGWVDPIEIQKVALKIILSSQESYDAFLKTKGKDFIVLFSDPMASNSDLKIYWTKEQLAAYGLLQNKSGGVYKGNNFLGQAYAHAHKILEYYEKHIYNSFSHNFPLLPTAYSAGFTKVLQQYIYNKTGKKIPINLYELVGG